MQLTPEQEQRILKNRKLIYHLLKKYKIRSGDYDDYEQIGMLGLTKAVATFDETKKTKFSTYAATCISNEIKMEFRKRRKQYHEVLMGELIQRKDSNKEDNLELEDMIYDEETSEFEEKMLDNMEKQENLEKCMHIILNHLAKRETIIYLLMVGGLSQPKIGKLLGISRTHVCRIEQKSICKMKENMGMKEVIKSPYSVLIQKSQIEISFSTDEKKEFYQAFANFLIKNAKSPLLYQTNFKVISENKKITIFLLVEEASFEFLGRLLLEMY